MKAIVCVKQVPDTTGNVEVNPNGTLNRASMTPIINPDDLYALEQALILKDKYGARVCVISMGPPMAEPMLRELLAMGADEAVLISGREFGGADTYATSNVLAGAIEKYGIDENSIVFCGRQAIDGDTAQVGPQIAEKLDIPQITYAASLEVEGNEVRALRMTDTNNTVVATRMPCLITVVKNKYVPRYMNTIDIMAAYHKPLTIYDFNTLDGSRYVNKETVGLGGSPTQIYRSFAPIPRPKHLKTYPADRNGIAGLLDEIADSNGGIKI